MVTLATGAGVVSVGDKVGAMDGCEVDQLLVMARHNSPKYSVIMLYYYEIVWNLQLRILVDGLQNTICLILVLTFLCFPSPPLW